MRLIIEARLEGSETGTPGPEARVVAVIERQDHSVADLGLTLAEGRALFAKVQAGLVVHQTADWTVTQAACGSCGAMLAHKDSRTIIMRTVFGKVARPSPLSVSLQAVAFDLSIGTTGPFIVSPAFVLALSQ